MRATETKVLDFLKGPKQFVIPIYQRTYKWTTVQCERLWKDIVGVATDETISGHFIGSIIYMEKGSYSISPIPQLLVIDGQQRLTTLSLLLSALTVALRNDTIEGDKNAQKLLNDYLLNVEEDTNLRYKLLLTPQDRNSLIHLIEGRQQPGKLSRNIQENYKYFSMQISSSPLAIEDIYQGIAKLIMVDISLDRDNDNPQLIFESLNSTGIELSQVDLIRNYILMGLPPEEQDRIYTHYWRRIERGLMQAENSEYFDRFMRDYLTVKTGKIPNRREVYQHFKAYASSKQSGSIAEIMADIFKFATYFVSMVFLREENNDLREHFQEILTLNVDTAYPFLLEVYDDYKAGQLILTDFITILELIESYVFRRMICNISSNSLNNTFATLCREIEKKNYVESLKAVFHLKDSYRRFPTDKEFIQAFILKDVYNLHCCRYLLRRLENYRRKEQIAIETYTIEHIMPQTENLSSTWIDELGSRWQEVHARYLHTLGNLTLTEYNSELSNRPYMQKRTMEGGFVDSQIQLNCDLAEILHWDERAIISRSERLGRIATQIWISAELPLEKIVQYRLIITANQCGITGDKQERWVVYRQHHKYLEGGLWMLFEYLREKVMGLDVDIIETVDANSIHYQASPSTPSFLHVLPRNGLLRLVFPITTDKFEDPHRICYAMCAEAKALNKQLGPTCIDMSVTDEVNNAIEIIQQAYNLIKVFVGK